MRIYLAGKIDSLDWRHHVVKGLTETLATLNPANGWPMLEASIHGIHDYLGPFFKKVNKEDPTQMGVKIHRLCLEAVDNSDLVYAWVDDPSCYATIYEMGYAHAKGKFTAVAYPKEFDRSELWFMGCCSDEIIEADSPTVGLALAMMKVVRSGRVKNPEVELDRVRKNLQRLEEVTHAGEAKDGRGDLPGQG